MLSSFQCVWKKLPDILNLASRYKLKKENVADTERQMTSWRSWCQGWWQRWKLFATHSGGHDHGGGGEWDGDHGGGGGDGHNFYVLILPLPLSVAAINCATPVYRIVCVGDMIEVPIRVCRYINLTSSSIFNWLFNSSCLDTSLVWSQHARSSQSSLIWDITQEEQNKCPWLPRGFTFSILLKNWSHSTSP